jgi:poly-gamma-glutamate capsule biosynthesis protein CapA/YwtB (metallophosphatase superfamily)
MKYLILLVVALMPLSGFIGAQELEKAVLESAQSIPEPGLYNPAVEILTLTFSGDIMAHDNNYKMEDFNEIYQDVREVLLADDLSFGNLEFPVDPSRPFSTFPRFNVKPSYVEAAIRGGFDVFTLANNHSNDQYGPGMDNGIDALLVLQETYPFAFTGIHKESLKDFEDWEMLILEQKGLKIGFIGITALLNSLSARDQIQYLPYLSYWHGYKEGSRADHFLDWIKRKKSEVDFLILALHDGVEYRRTPLPGKRQYYIDLVDAGVDILWAHHPHVLQPMEWLRHGDRSALIMYSMGNFISGQTYYLWPSMVDAPRSYTGDSLLTQVRLRIIDGQAQILSVQGLPFVHYVQPNREIVVRGIDELLSEIEGQAWERFFQVRKEYLKGWRSPQILGDRRMVP